MRNISRFRLRAHTVKVEAAAWLKDGSWVCDQCPGEDEHAQNEVHALSFCQDHRACELRKHFLFLFTPFFKDFSAAQPFLLQQVNNHVFMISFLNRTIDSFSFWAYGCICDWPRPVSNQSAKQPGWRSLPIVTIVTIVHEVVKVVYWVHVVGYIQVRVVYTWSGALPFFSSSCF